MLISGETYFCKMVLECCLYYLRAIFQETYDSILIFSLDCYVFSTELPKYTGSLLSYNDYKKIMKIKQE